MISFLNCPFSWTTSAAILQHVCANCFLYLILLGLAHWLPSGLCSNATSPMMTKYSGVSQARSTWLLSQPLRGWVRKTEFEISRCFLVGFRPFWAMQWDRVSTNKTTSSLRRLTFVRFTYFFSVQLNHIWYAIGYFCFNLCISWQPPMESHFHKDRVSDWLTLYLQLLNLLMTGNSQ